MKPGLSAPKFRGNLTAESAVISPAARLARTSEAMLGAAIADAIAITATTVINSIKVKPWIRLRVCPII